MLIIRQIITASVEEGRMEWKEECSVERRQRKCKMHSKGQNEVTDMQIASTEEQERMT